MFVAIGNLFGFTHNFLRCIPKPYIFIDYLCSTIMPLIFTVGPYQYFPYSLETFKVFLGSTKTHTFWKFVKAVQD